LNALCDKTRIVLIEGHAILRDGLRALLEREPDLTVAGSIGAGAGAFDLVRTTGAQLVISDVLLPDRSGIALIRELLTSFPGLRVLVLTAHAAEDYVRAALNIGVHGYVLKDSGQADFLEAIRTVMSGRQYLCTAAAARIAKPRAVGKRLVTGREKQVLTCVALGRSNKWIARDLGLSVKTVEKHRANFMRKLTLHNTAAITLFALRHGLIEPGAIEHQAD
jgi:two-component system, NarL family, nitrate/nitrite response regulator NarL